MKSKAAVRRDVASAATKRGQTPLEFMLEVMNDPAEEMKLRAQMAQAAAPYVHAKPGEEKMGKKEEQQEKANEIANRFRGVGPPTLKAVK